MKIFALFFSIIVLISCNDNNDSTEPQEENISIDSLGEPLTSQSDDFIKMLGTNDEISAEMALLFIKPALEEQYHYRYREQSDFIYEYGELLYEDDTLFICTFSQDGDDGTNMLAAEFIASFNKQTDEFIDSRLIGSNSDFEGHTSIGYNTKTTISYDINLMNDNNLILLVKCELKDVFYNFNEAVSDKPEELEETQLTSYEVHVEKNGEMFDTLEE